MIEKIENPEDLNEWRGRDIYSIRILALAKSYSTKYNFCTFYRQTDGKRVTALISKLDNNVTLSLTDGYDRDELVQFFCLTGYSSILCDASFELNPRFEEGDVMVCNAKRELLPQNYYIDEYPKLMDLFNFVDYNAQDFKAWYVDISHRVRHKTAKAFTLNIDGEIISSGILSSIYDNYAILTAVRTNPEHRGQGFGSLLVKNICCEVSGDVYIMREQGRNESFYEQLGFKNIGKWRMYQ